MELYTLYFGRVNLNPRWVRSKHSWCNGRHHKNCHKVPKPKTWSRTKSTQTLILDKSSLWPSQHDARTRTVSCSFQKWSNVHCKPDCQSHNLWHALNICGVPCKMTIFTIMWKNRMVRHGGILNTYVFIIMYAEFYYLTRIPCNISDQHKLLNTHPRPVEIPTTQQTISYWCMPYDLKGMIFGCFFWETP